MADPLFVMPPSIRADPGYNRRDAPSISMYGTSIDRDSEHGRTVTAQLTRPHETLEGAITSPVSGLAAAGTARSLRRQARGSRRGLVYNHSGCSPTSH